MGALFTSISPLKFSRSTMGEMAGATFVHVPRRLHGAGKAVFNSREHVSDLGFQDYYGRAGGEGIRGEG